MFTIDNSVWINAESPAETGHAQSRAFIDRVIRTSVPVVVPTLLRAEVAGVISRIRADPGLAVRYSGRLAALPFIRWIGLDPPLADRAAALAANQGLRGADAVYAAVALEYGCTLVSLDKEHLTRLTSVVTTLKPADALALLPPP